MHNFAADWQVSYLGYNPYSPGYSRVSCQVKNSVEMTIFKELVDLINIVYAALDKFSAFRDIVNKSAAEVIK